MKLLEALEIIRKPTPEDAKVFRVFLVCGFTPDHFQTFLHANLKQAHPEARIEITHGIYGDFAGNLARVAQENPDAAVLVMEWSDLDPRLGLRSLGSWAPDSFDDILRNVHSRAAQFQEVIARLAPNTPLVISFPTLPLPPVSFTPGTRASSFELALRSEVAGISLFASKIRNVAVLNSQKLDQLSPLANRFDVKAELASGFPYKLPQASVLASLLALLVHPPAPKKGLITDLDDTLWSGILGEVGTDGVSWDLEHHTHMHAAYQKLLHALSEAGVLIAVASKNDAKFAEEALLRADMILPRKALFPLEINWGPKSDSVKKILKAWNIGEDAVVFVDDSPMELAEVESAHPQIACLTFPKDDPQAINDLLYRLRELFGKSALSEEDAIRRESLLRAQSIEDSTDGHGKVSEEFLKQAGAEVSLSFSKQPLDPRALELVNKTNQFNLNGRRYAEKEWQDFVTDPASVLLVVSYKDKYGPLGKIAILAGRLAGRTLHLDVWVMSCRAFSRRIEHRCLEELFERFALDEMIFDFTPTPKNGPLREFLAEILGAESAPRSRLSRALFFERRQDTFHRVLELTNG